MLLGYRKKFLVSKSKIARYWAMIVLDSSRSNAGSIFLSTSKHCLVVVLETGLPELIVLSD